MYLNECEPKIRLLAGQTVICFEIHTGIPKIGILWCNEEYFGVNDKEIGFDWYIQMTMPIRHSKDSFDIKRMAEFGIDGPNTQSSGGTNVP